MFEVLDMVHNILEEQKITAEKQLQLNIICDLKDKLVMDTIIIIRKNKIAPKLK